MHKALPLTTGGTPCLPLAPVRDLLFEPKGKGIFHLKGEPTTGATDVPTPPALVV